MDGCKRIVCLWYKEEVRAPQQACYHFIARKAKTCSSCRQLESMTAFADPKSLYCGLNLEDVQPHNTCENYKKIPNWVGDEC